MAKFWIAIASIVIFLAVATTITIVILNKQTINVDFEFAEISVIKTYNESTIANTVDYDYAKVQNELNSSMKIKKLSTIGKNFKINTTVRIDVNAKFSNNVTANNKCVELEFASEQTQIAHYNENTKKITYTKLLIVLNGSNEISDHIVFYSNGGDYQDQPMVIAFSESVLQELFK